MISMVYRRKGKLNGKVESDRLYRGRYRLDGDAKITEVPLHTSDKRIALQNLEKIVRQKQLESAGLALPEAVEKAPQVLLVDHLKAYVRDLQASGRDEKYVYILEKQIRKLMSECS